MCKCLVEMGSEGQVLPPRLCNPGEGRFETHLVGTNSPFQMFSDSCCFSQQQVSFKNAVCRIQFSVLTTHRPLTLPSLSKPGENTRCGIAIQPRCPGREFRPLVPQQLKSLGGPSGSHASSPRLSGRGRRPAPSNTLGRSKVRLSGAGKARLTVNCLVWASLPIFREISE